MSMSIHLNRHGFSDWDEQMLAEAYPECTLSDGSIDLDALHNRDHNQIQADLDHEPDDLT